MTWVLAYVCMYVCMYTYIHTLQLKPARPLFNNRLHWRERKVAFGFQLFSACLSLTVGVLWLVLKSCGLLEQVFG